MARKTYHYDPDLKRMVEGPGPRKADQGSGDSWRFSDRAYSDKPFKAHDGTVIDSRKKHREYMKRHELTTIDDYTGTWQKAQSEREAFYKGEHQGVRRERKEDIARIIHTLENRRGR
jgi:hypothetical protein